MSDVIAILFILALIPLSCSEQYSAENNITKISTIGHVRVVQLDGIECVTFKSGYAGGIDCNWDD